MKDAVRGVLVALVALSFSAVATAAAGDGAGKQQQIDQLIGLHDLTTSVSIGNYYLKQEALVAVRGLLARLGRDLEDTARSYPRTVGIAAPQIGELWRVAWIDCTDHPMV